tara:strand:- start:1501 stop:2127 length:627 start_codon:yes stop_codon:yes gene_type:complete
MNINQEISDLPEAKFLHKWVFSDNQPKHLTGALCYLVGPIDYAPDQGTGWREELIHQCNDVWKMGIKFLNPTDKVEGLKQEVDEEQDKVNMFKKNQQWDELSMFMKPIIRGDHRCIDLSDFIVVYIDKDIHACGSYFEFQSALHEKKPYFVLVKGGKAQAPSWLFGILDHNYMFGSLKELVESLCKHHVGDIPLSDRWVLIRKQIELL